MIIRTPPKLTNPKGVDKYVEVNLWNWLRDLTVGLNKIDFQQNFQAFIITDVLIEASTEIGIPNELNTAYPGVIPSGRIIIRQKGDALIIDGDQPWTSTQLYLKNTSATNDATVSVLFFK